MKYYSVLAVTPTSQDWIQDYLDASNPLVKKHGGTYLARTSNHEQLEGEDDPADLRIVIEWESREGAMAFMNDPKYKPHHEKRLANSDSRHFLIEGKDELA